MKLRLKGNEGNSLRLRLSRSEMHRLLRGEPIVEDVRFGPGDGASFRYGLVSDSEATLVETKCAAGVVTVSVPSGRVKLWSAENEVGIYETLALEDGATLELVLEKDFACLDRADADNADTFAHPHSGAAC